MLKRVMKEARGFLVFGGFPPKGQPFLPQFGKVQLMLFSLKNNQAPGLDASLRAPDRCTISPSQNDAFEVVGCELDQSGLSSTLVDSTL